MALEFLEYYNTTIQFHSTLAYLKDPPKEYQQPAVDLVAGLEQIQQRVKAGYYQNQYTFEAELQLLVQSAHDSHLVLTAGILSAFVFLSPFSIVSVSADGRGTPQVYFAGAVPSQPCEPS
jgi:hypothetical protein